jgi:hypothetical protein
MARTLSGFFALHLFLLAADLWGLFSLQRFDFRAIASGLAAQNARRDALYFSLLFLSLKHSIQERIDTKRSLM